MEQFVRDARIAMLYEGANGIQALDLVGRKLPRDGGRALQAFLAEANGYVKERDGETSLAPYVAPLRQSLGDLQQATMWFVQHALGNPEHAGALQYYIHMVEASSAPERALPYARRLAAQIPGAGHLVHMPFHVYYRVGDYKAAVVANRNRLFMGASS